MFYRKPSGTPNVHSYFVRLIVILKYPDDDSPRVETCCVKA